MVWRDKEYNQIFGFLYDNKIKKKINKSNF